MFIGATNKMRYGKLHETILPKDSEIEIVESKDEDFSIHAKIPMFVLPMSKRLYIWSKHMDSKKF